MNHTIPFLRLFFMLCVSFLFAKYFNLPIKNIFEGVSIDEAAFEDKAHTILKDSVFLNGLSYAEAMPKVIATLEKQQLGVGTTTFRLRDAIFSRQRYWGEPIPIYYKDGWPQPLSEEDLPLELPAVEKYLPTPEGAPPLGNAQAWAWDTKNKKVVDNSAIDHQTIFPLELNTMPGWAGSSWYFLRYMDPHNENAFVSEESVKYWGQVDLYIGGSEHATGHLLYSRFWTKFLFDLGYLPFEEPFKKLINQGMILGTSAFVYRLEGENTYVSQTLVGDQKVQPIHVDVSLVNASNELDVEAFRASTRNQEAREAKFILDDGKYIVGREVEKMSKSKYNVQTPDDLVERYGADTLRCYEMFLGPIEQAKPWNTAGITGVFGFLNKFWRLFHANDTFTISEGAASMDALKVLHGTIEKVTQDIEQLSLNTAVSAFMICVNELTTLKCNQREVLEPLTILLSPFAPHICEEVWSLLGHDGSIVEASFPAANQEYLKETSKKYPISFNGKVRFTMDFDVSADPKLIEEKVLADDRTQQQLGGKAVRKVIVVPNKIVNVVC